MIGFRRIAAACVLVSGVVATFAVTFAAAIPETVQNPSLEQVTSGVPTCFQRSGHGSNTVSWSLTNVAHSGQVAQSLTITGYRNGDRKLLIKESADCAPSVTAGKKYSLSVWYKSTSPATNLSVFRHSTAGWTYWTDVTRLPTAASWTLGTGTTPPVPEGTDMISFGVSLAGNGTLVTDDYAMTAVGAPPPPPPPEPSDLTFNGGLELGGDPPTGWFVAGWGDATLTAGVTADAHSGSRAFSLTLSGRTEGDYKLLPDEGHAAAVQPGAVYELSVWYRSTSAANSVTLFAHKATGWEYYTDLATLPAAAAWTREVIRTPPIAAGIDALAWGVSLFGNGTLVTDDYSTTKIADAPPPPDNGPAAVGRWTVLGSNMPIRAIHATVLQNGNVLLVAGSGNNLDRFNAGTFEAAVWDPVANSFQVLGVPKDMFCSGHVTLADGRVLIQGGTKSYPSSAGGADYGGLKDTWIFDPGTRTFSTAPAANEGHWYPTLTMLGNGDVWMGGGLKEDTTGAVNTEYWDALAQQWKPTWQVPQTWSFWGLYPHMLLLSDGRLFYSGGHVFGNGLAGTGASIYDWQNGTIADVPGLRQKDMRDQSASVLLPPAQDQRVAITGGGNINSNTPAINLTDIIDLKSATPAYQAAANLPGDGKMYLNATTLPDRTVLTTNGGRFNRDDSANVFTAAIYDPAAGAWTSVAADPVGRNYHSTAVLLPDGRVAAIGSNPGDGTFELRISVYEPPYLFKTARPVIVNAPPSVTYGQTFTFSVTTDNTIRWAQFMRPMSATHQADPNMRLVELPVSVSGGVATASVPTNPNLLPPGPYMLTVTDSRGIPSRAQWVNVR
jgi:Domain of unknown function (DUF1929)